MGLMRRRGMLKEESGEGYETLFDVTLSSESGTINTPNMSNGLVARFNAGVPKKLIMRLYAVTPQSGTVRQVSRLCYWQSGVGIKYNLVNSSNSGTQSFDCGDGSVVSLEAVAEITEGSVPSDSYYRITWENNIGGSGVRASARGRLFQFVFNTCLFTARGSTALGVGSRLVVLAQF